VTTDLAALEARVAKLEGNIAAADLAGTYSLIVFNTSMTAFHSGAPAIPATISTGALRTTLTLNANGTGTVGAQQCEGSTLTQGTWAMNGTDCSDAGGSVTWTYAAGIVTVNFPADNEQIPFNVGVGGRLLVNAFAPFHPDDPSSDQILFVASRLK
jgi:hypothetical protein